MINPDDIKAGMVLGQTDAMILRAAVARLNNLELEILALRKGRDIPEGWQLVPTEPSEDMIAAGTSVDGGLYSIWKDMLTAAPEAK